MEATALIWFGTALALIQGNGASSEPNLTYTYPEGNSAGNTISHGERMLFASLNAGFGNLNGGFGGQNTGIGGANAGSAQTKASATVPASNAVRQHIIGDRSAGPFSFVNPGISSPWRSICSVAPQIPMCPPQVPEQQPCLECAPICILMPHISECAPRPPPPPVMYQLVPMCMMMPNMPQCVPQPPLSPPPPIQNQPLLICDVMPNSPQCAPQPTLTDIELVPICIMKPYSPQCAPRQPYVDNQQLVICNVMPQMPRCAPQYQPEPTWRQEAPYWWILMPNQVCNPPMARPTPYCRCYLGIPTNQQGTTTYTCGP